MWESVIATVTGGVIAIAGSTLGHRWQTREARRERHETYDREDSYRLFRDRLDAYRAFNLAFGSARQAMATYSHFGRSDEWLEKVVHARSEVWQTGSLIWLIGDRDVAAAAGEILRFVDGVVGAGEDFDDARWRDLVRSYVDVARADVLRKAYRLTSPDHTTTR